MSREKNKLKKGINHFSGCDISDVELNDILEKASVMNEKEAKNYLESFTLSPLEALEILKYNCVIYYEDYKLFEIIETALKEQQERIEELEETNNLMAIREHKNTKKIKALEIIKEKPVVALVDYKYTYEEWLERVGEIRLDVFKNKEEYELLKEVLL